MTSSRAVQLCSLAIAALAALAGCTDGDTQPLADRVVIEDLGIQGIDVSSSKTVIAVTEVLTLSAVDSVSGADIGDSLRWSSSAPSVATVEGAGVVTGVSDGSVTITASVGTLEGSTTLDVSSAGLLSIALSSSDVPIDVCTNGQFVATGTFADGRIDDVTEFADWQSADTTLGTFDAATPGLLRTQVAGTIDVTASLAGVTSPVFPAVISDSLTGVTLESTATSIEVDTTAQLTALGNYGGTSADISDNATFASATESVATVDAAGEVTAVATGTSVLSASCNGLQGDLTLTVTGRSTTLISLDPIGSEPFSVALNGTLQLEVEATFEDLSTRNVTEEASWSLAPGSIPAVSVSNLAGSKGLVTPNFVGTSQVRVEFESEDITIEVQVGQ